MPCSPWVNVPFSMSGFKITINIIRVLTNQYFIEKGIIQCRGIVFNHFMIGIRSGTILVSSSHQREPTQIYSCLIYRVQNVYKINACAIIFFYMNWAWYNLFHFQWLHSDYRYIEPLNMNMTMITCRQKRLFKIKHK